MQVYKTRNQITNPLIRVDENSSTNSCSTSSLSIIENSAPGSQLSNNWPKKRKTSLEMKCEEDEKNNLKRQNPVFFHDEINSRQTVDTFRPSSLTSFNFFENEYNFERLIGGGDCGSQSSNLGGDGVDFGHMVNSKKTKFKKKFFSFGDFKDYNMKNNTDYNEKNKKINFSKFEKETAKKKPENNNFRVEFSVEFTLEMIKRELKKGYICTENNIIFEEEEKKSNCSLKNFNEKKMKFRKNEQFVVESFFERQFEILEGEEKKLCETFLMNYKKIIHN